MKFESRRNYYRAHTPRETAERAARDTHNGNINGITIVDLWDDLAAVPIEDEYGELIGSGSPDDLADDNWKYISSHAAYCMDCWRDGSDDDNDPGYTARDLAWYWYLWSAANLAEDILAAMPDDDTDDTAI